MRAERIGVATLDVPYDVALRRDAKVWESVSLPQRPSDDDAYETDQAIRAVLFAAP